jgi:hypothetical protein
MAASLPARGAERVALVVGNGAYANTTTLQNPANDAREMAATLRLAGFEVIELEDANRRTMIDGLRVFGEKLSPGGVGLFFYAGHGIQRRGENYLLPTDVVLAGEGDLKYEGFDVEDVLASMDEARVRLSLVILDACRDNPFARSFRSTARGLAQIDPPRGALVAYATAPGKAAADGDDGHGLYTAELLAAMKVPGLNLKDVFERATDAVESKTAKAQLPWVNSSFRGDFYFFAPPGPARPVQAAATPPSTADGEAAFWDSIKDSVFAADFDDYLQRWGNSAAHSRGAAARRDALRLQPDAISPVGATRPGSSDFTGRWTAEGDNTFCGKWTSELTVNANRLKVSFRNGNKEVRTEATMGNWDQVDQAVTLNSLNFIAAQSQSRLVGSFPKLTLTGTNLSCYPVSFVFTKSATP